MLKQLQKHPKTVCSLCWLCFITGFLLLHFSSFKFESVGIPCLVYKTTGILCPSCGITRMIDALISLDFLAAFSYHPVFFCAAVALFVYAVYATIYVFIKNKFPKPGKLFLFSVIFFAIVLSVFTIVRNL